MYIENTKISNESNGARHHNIFNLHPRNEVMHICTPRKFILVNYVKVSK